MISIGYPLFFLEKSLRSRTPAPPPISGRNVGWPRIDPVPPSLAGVGSMVLRAIERLLRLGFGEFAPVTPLYFRTAELHRKLIDPGPSGAVREIAA